MKNPFELNELIAVNNTDVVFDDHIYKNISKLEAIGSEQLEKFISECSYLTGSFCFEFKLSNKVEECISLLKASCSTSTRGGY